MPETVAARANRQMFSAIDSLSARFHPEGMIVVVGKDENGQANMGARSKVAEPGIQFYSPETAERFEYGYNLPETRNLERVATVERSQSAAEEKLATGDLRWVTVPLPQKVLEAQKGYFASTPAKLVTTSGYNNIMDPVLDAEIRPDDWHLPGVSDDDLREMIKNGNLPTEAQYTAKNHLENKFRAQFLETRPGTALLSYLDTATGGLVSLTESGRKARSITAEINPEYAKAGENIAIISDIVSLAGVVKGGGKWALKQLVKKEGAETVARAGSRVAVDVAESGVGREIAGNVTDGAQAVNGAGKAGFSGAYKTNGELVQSIASRADNWGARKGLHPVNGATGTRQHKYAENLLNRYQDIFGSRGLSAEARYINGQPWVSGSTKNSIQLDVVEGPLDLPTTVWDYKFGNAKLSQSRISQIKNGIPKGANVPILEIKP